MKTETHAAKFSRFRIGDGFRADEAASMLERDGIIILENVLAPAEVAALRDEVTGLAQKPPKWLKSHPTQNGFFFSFSPMTVRKHGGDGDIGRLASVFGKPELGRLSRGQLGPMWYIDRIILDHKKPSPEPITDWHADQFVDNGRCTKFMLYLTDTDAGNGAFSYVPGSHQLMRALANQHDKDNRELHLVEDIRAKAATAIASDPNAGATVRKLLAEMEEHIVSARQSDDHYTVAAPGGSVVVFDANGIHRGGVVRERERLLARSHCREFRMMQALTSPRALKVAAERVFLRLSGPRARSA